MKRLSPALLWLALLAALPASAQFKPWGGGDSRGVTTKNLQMPLSGETHYSDRYTAEAWFEDGTRVWVSVLVKNFGLSPGLMTVKSRWYEKDGKEHYSKHELKRGRYTVTAEPFSVEAAGHKLWGTPRHFRVRGKSGPYSYELHFKSGLRPFRPGTGRTNFDALGEKYYDQTRVQPRAVVTGWVKKGAKTALKGYGYVTHSIATIAPYEMYKRYLQIRSIDGDTVVYIDQFRTTGRAGGKAHNVGYVYVARGGKVIAASRGARLKLGKMHTDSAHANRYKVPMRVETELKRKGKVIHITVEADKIIGRDDVLASAGGLKGAIIRQYAQPVTYTMRAKVTVSVSQDGAEPVVTTFPAAYELSHLNK